MKHGDNPYGFLGSSLHWGGKAEIHVILCLLPHEKEVWSSRRNTLSDWVQQGETWARQKSHSPGCYLAECAVVSRVSSWHLTEDRQMVISFFFKPRWTLKWDLRFFCVLGVALGRLDDVEEKTNTIHWIEIHMLQYESRPCGLQDVWSRTNFWCLWASVSLPTI